jgi:hypothetical protein
LEDRILINLSFLTINLYVLFTAWFVHIAMGMIWFRPELFGKQWSKLIGQELKPAAKWLVPGMLGHLTMVLVLCVLLRLSHFTGAFGGICIGFLTWLGFIVPMEVAVLIWEKITFRLFLIRTGNQFLGILTSGAILGVWR